MFALEEVTDVEPRRLERHRVDKGVLCSKCCVKFVKADFGKLVRQNTRMAVRVLDVDQTVGGHKFTLVMCGASGNDRP